MGIYSRYVLPKIVNYVCGMRPTMRQREKIVHLARGRVLEIGIGSGLNLPFYESENVEKIWGLDPSPEIWALAKDNVDSSGSVVEFLEASAESIPLDAASVDTVVVTYSLCTIPDGAAALKEMKRVLVDGGKLLFCEHGAAPDANVRKWQDRINPIWSVFSGGCRINIDVPALLRAGEFEIENLETMYLPGFKPASFNYWGMAR